MSRAVCLRRMVSPDWCTERRWTTYHDDGASFGHAHVRVRRRRSRRKTKTGPYVPFSWIGSRRSCAASTRMGMEITHLGSGSAGNSTLLRSEETCVLIDCGFSLKQMEARLGLAGVEPSSIDAILVTHHHSDHSKTALRASKNWDSVYIPILKLQLGWDGSRWQNAELSSP